MAPSTGTRLRSGSWASASLNQAGLSGGLAFERGQGRGDLRRQARLQRLGLVLLQALLGNDVAGLIVGHGEMTNKRLKNGKPRCCGAA